MSLERLRKINEYVQNGFQIEDPFVAEFVATILRKGGKPEENFKQHIFSNFLSELGYPPSAEIPSDVGGIIDYAFENGVGIEVKAPLDKKRLKSKIYSVRFLQQHFPQVVNYLENSDFLDFMILTDGINWFFFSKKSIRNTKNPFFYHADFSYIAKNIHGFRYERLRDTLHRLEEISYREPLESRFFRALARWVEITNRDINDIQRSIHFINALIFVRTLEDLGALHAAYLRKIFRHYEQLYPIENDVVRESVDFIYRHIYQIYDTELFKLRPDGISFDTIRALLFGTSLDSEFQLDTLYDFNFALIDFDVLGHVYERYLAELRREKGIFYTPHWMVDMIVERALEGMINPILDSARSKLQENDFNGAISEIRKLMELKILDPACGSGTFLAKSYVKLVRAIEDFRDEFIEAYNRYVRESNSGNNHFMPMAELNRDYDLTKRHHLGQHWRERLMFTLYGIDYDPRAVEVTKLNLWLALIRMNPSKFYFKDLAKMNVQKVLPNLSMNIRAGDSLKTTDLKEQEKMLDPQLVNLRKNYFRDYIVQSDAVDEYFHVLNRIIQKYELDQDGVYYLLYFPEVFEKGGFDIVIGNPPYIGEEDHKELFAKTKEYPLVRTRKWYMGKMDYWYFFSHLALELLRRGGIHAFIVPSYWLKSFGSRNLVKDFEKKGRFIEIWEFGKFRVFYTKDEEERPHYVGVDSLVFFFEKDDGGNDYEILYFRMPDEALELDRETLIEKLHGIISKHRERTGLRIRNGNIYIGRHSIAEQMDRIKDAVLEDIFNINQGIVAAPPKIDRKIIRKLTKNSPTPLEEFLEKHGINIGDGVFVVSEIEKHRILKAKSPCSRKSPDCPDDASVFKPFFYASNIEPFFLNQYDEEWVIYITNGLAKRMKDDPCCLPLVRQHLDRFKDFITSDNRPYGLHRARRQEIFEGEKVVSVRQARFRQRMAYVPFPAYFDLSVNLITYKGDNNPVSLKTLTCILNSDIAFEWFKFNCTWRGDTLQIDRNVLARFPIRIPSTEMQERFEALHDEVVDLKRELNENTRKFKNMVHNLKLKPEPVNKAIVLSESYIASESLEFDSIEVEQPLTIKIYRSGEITTLKFRNMRDRIGFEYAFLVEGIFGLYHLPHDNGLESLIELQENLQDRLQDVDRLVRELYSIT